MAIKAKIESYRSRDTHIEKVLLRKRIEEKQKHCQLNCLNFIFAKNGDGLTMSLNCHSFNRCQWNYSQFEEDAEWPVALGLKPTFCCATIEKSVI